MRRSSCRGCWSLKSNRPRRKSPAAGGCSSRPGWGERTASILGPNFWAEVRQDLPQDAARLAALGRDVQAALRAAPGWLYGAVLLGLGLIAALRWWLGQRIAAADLHARAAQPPAPLAAGR